MKTKYLNAQKKILETIPVNPFELTTAGISELKKNIIVSIVSLAACMSMSLIVLRWVFSSEGMAADGLTVMFLKLATYLALLFVSLFFMSKSTDYVLGTGIYWRLSVSDELQDEWELAQKHRSYTKAFEYVIYGAAFLFILALIYCGVVFAMTGALPNPPSFGVSVITAALLIYISALAPLMNIAWTLTPIEPDGGSEKTKMPQKRKRVDPLTPKQKKLKFLWQWSPIVVGLILGISIGLNT